MPGKGVKAVAGKQGSAGGSRRASVAQTWPAHLTLKETCAASLVDVAALAPRLGVTEGSADKIWLSSSLTTMVSPPASWGGTDAPALEAAACCTGRKIREDSGGRALSFFRAHTRVAARTSGGDRRAPYRRSVALEGAPKERRKHARNQAKALHVNAAGPKHGPGLAAARLSVLFLKEARAWDGMRGVRAGTTRGRSDQKPALCRLHCKGPRRQARRTAEERNVDAAQKVGQQRLEALEVDVVLLRRLDEHLVVGEDPAGGGRGGELGRGEGCRA